MYLIVITYIMQHVTENRQIQLGNEITNKYNIGIFFHKFQDFIVIKHNCHKYFQTKVI